MHAVGPDQDVSLDLPAVREARGHGPVAVLDAGAAGTEVDGRRVELGSQQLLQLGPVDQDEPGPPPLCHQVPREGHQPGAVGPPEALPANVHRQLRHLAGQPDWLQRRHGVRPQAHPRPDLFQDWCLLIDLGGQAPAGQGDGRRQPSDPAADNGNLRSHARNLPSANRPGRRPERATICGRA